MTASKLPGTVSIKEWQVPTVAEMVDMFGRMPPPWRVEFLRVIRVRVKPCGECRDGLIDDGISNRTCRACGGLGFHKEWP